MPRHDVENCGEKYASNKTWNSKGKSLNDDGSHDVLGVEPKGSKHSKLKSLLLNVRQHEGVDQLRAQDGQEDDNRSHDGVEEHCDHLHRGQLGLEWGCDSHVSSKTELLDDVVACRTQPVQHVLLGSGVDVNLAADCATDGHGVVAEVHPLQLLLDRFVGVSQQQEVEGLALHKFVEGRHVSGLEEHRSVLAVKQRDVAESVTKLAVGAIEVREHCEVVGQRRWQQGGVEHPVDKSFEWNTELACISVVKSSQKSREVHLYVAIDDVTKREAIHDHGIILNEGKPQACQLREVCIWEQPREVECWHSYVEQTCVDGFKCLPDVEVQHVVVGDVEIVPVSKVVNKVLASWEPPLNDLVDLLSDVGSVLSRTILSSEGAT